MAERVTEQVYLQMWRAAPRFDPDQDSARSLLMRTALRELIHHIHGIDGAPPPPAAGTSRPERS